MQFSKSITGCKYGDDFATFWGRTLLEMVCKNQVLTIGTKLLEMGSLSRPIQHRFFRNRFTWEIWNCHQTSSFDIVYKSYRNTVNG